MSMNLITMPKVKTAIAALLLSSLVIAPISLRAGDEKDAKKPKPYILKTCPVSGDTLGEMGKPYTFVYKDREIKLCCPSCKKDFEKSPAKFIKKIEKEEAKAKKDAGKAPAEKKDKA